MSFNKLIIYFFINARDDERDSPHVNIQTRRFCICSISRIRKLFPTTTADTLLPATSGEGRGRIVLSREVSVLFISFSAQIQPSIGHIKHKSNLNTISK